MDIDWILSLGDVTLGNIHYTAWKRLDEKFDHEIYLEMNPENCSSYLKFFDFIKMLKWTQYARNN